MFYTLKVLDGEALDQVYDKLRAASSALRYAKTHKMAHYEAVGMTSGVLATIVAANIYGKDVRPNLLQPPHSDPLQANAIS